MKKIYQKKKNSFLSKDKIVYGKKPVLEALEAGVSIEKIFVKSGTSSDYIIKIKELCSKADIPLQFVPSVKLNKITNQNHQGIILLLSSIDYYNVEDILSQVYENGDLPLFMVLDGITDIHNIGAIARSAWGTGVQALIIPNKGNAVVNSAAIKKSAGALLHLPVCRTNNLEETVNFLKKNGLNIVSLGLEGKSKWLHELKACQPMAIIMGAEGEGISEITKSLSDEIVKIPIKNNFDSYNVSVAAAMVLYETMKQRMLNDS